MSDALVRSDFQGSDFGSYDSEFESSIPEGKKQATQP